MPIAAAPASTVAVLVAATSLPRPNRVRLLRRHTRRPDRSLQGDVTGHRSAARGDHRAICPDETFAEGPFGEFWYPAGRAARPYMRVGCATAPPTLTCALMADGASNEAGLFWGALRSQTSGAICRRWAPGIRRMVDRAAGWGIGGLGQADVRGARLAVMALAAQCTAGAYFGKFIIVVDDIDPTNVHQVLWAWRPRPAGAVDRHPARDLEHLSRPSQGRQSGLGLKALINACMNYSTSRPSPSAPSCPRPRTTMWWRWQE